MERIIKTKYRETKVVIDRIMTTLTPYRLVLFLTVTSIERTMMDK